MTFGELQIGDTYYNYYLMEWCRILEKKENPCSIRPDWGDAFVVDFKSFRIQTGITGTWTRYPSPKLEDFGVNEVIRDGIQLFKSSKT